MDEYNMSKDQLRRGVEDILSNFVDANLSSLAATVTQGLLKDKINSREEAIKAIIDYSPNELNILRRKIVTRDVLFAYLRRKNIQITPPFTKTDLIDKIAAYWSIPVATATSECSNNNVTLLAEQFTQWFYSMMNSNEGIGSEHFYADSKLTISIHRDGECLRHLVEDNPLEAAQQLHRIRTEMNLCFNPNLTSDGVQGRIDPHGLVVVLACGTLHADDSCVGIFEQQFYLARDPFADNNWKIKRTEVSLKSKSDVMGLPALCDSNFSIDLPKR